MKTYYLYRHIRQDKNEVFYIGIGTLMAGSTKRSIYVRAFNKAKSRSAFWRKIVNKTAYEVEIIFHSQDIDLIKKKEKEFIRLYGRTKLGGTLCNLTDGGDGIDGFNHSDETKKVIGTHSKNRKRERDYRLNLSEDSRASKKFFMENRKISAETREKIAKALAGNQRGLGHKVSQENREKTAKRLNKKIFQYSIRGELLKEFESFIAAKNEGFDPKGINRNISGRTVSYKGFVWKLN